MVKTYLYQLTVASCLFLAACNESKTTDGRLRVIPLGTAIDARTELNASDCFKQVQYVPLETTDSSLIGKGPYVQVIKDRILISTSQDQCLMFDKETGKFIKQVGHIGNDPEGYRSVFCWGDNETGMIYFNGWNKDLVCYDQNGTFKEKIKIPFEVQGASSASFGCQNDGTFVLYKSVLFGKGENSLLFFKDNMAIDSCATRMAVESQSLDPSNIASIAVLKGETGAQFYGPTTYEGVLVLGLLRNRKPVTLLSMPIPVMAAG